MKFKITISSGILGFAEKVNKYWGLERYNPETDRELPLLFFGLYTLSDYDVLKRHNGTKMVFWCGSDLKRLTSNRKGRIERFKEIPISSVQHFVENEVEQEELKSLGVESIVRPSFLGDINDFPVSFKPSKTPHVFLSGHQPRGKEYGTGTLERIMKRVPEITFHFYGIKDESHDNLIFHGWVSDEQMNAEIKDYHCGLRINEHDGCSEVMVKSVLNGGYPITYINYPLIDNYKTDEELIMLLKDLKNKTEPNYEAREFWIKNLNVIPWLET